MKQYNTPVIKYAQQNNEAMKDAEIAPIKKIDTVIKRQLINYSYEEKYKLGILTEAEYYEWQLKLQREAQEAAAMAEAGSVSEEETQALNDLFGNSSSEVDTTKHTFWEGEDGDRENISNDAYEEFLRSNSIDVSNRTSTSFDELKALSLAEETNDSPIEDKALSEEVARIQALFMPTQGNIDQLFADNAESEDE